MIVVEVSVVLNWLAIIVATLKMVLVLLVIEVKTSVVVIEGQWP